MPYLQVDLDALEEFEMAGALAGIGAGPFALGCLRLWRDCWRRKTEYVTADRLPAFFPGADERKLTVAMTSCRFLEASGTEYRVKGAAKRLGIRKAQQDAGKKHLKNLRQYAKEEPETLSESPTGSPPGLPGDNPEVEPEETRRTSSGSTPALTASSQQPAASSRKEGGLAPPPLAADLEQRLADVFREVRGRAYRWGRGDLQALKALLADGEDPDEIARRFRVALRHAGYPRCDTVADMAKHWNAYATEESRAKPKGLTSNTTDAEFHEKTRHLKVDENGDLVL